MQAEADFVIRLRFVNVACIFDQSIIPCAWKVSRGTILLKQKVWWTTMSGLAGYYLGWCSQFWEFLSPCTVCWWTCTHMCRKFLDFHQNHHRMTPDFRPVINFASKRKRLVSRQSHPIPSSPNLIEEIPFSLSTNVSFWEFSAKTSTFFLLVPVKTKQCWDFWVRHQIQQKS